MLAIRPFQQRRGRMTDAGKGIANIRDAAYRQLIAVAAEGDAASAADICAECGVVLPQSRGRGHVTYGGVGGQIPFLDDAFQVARDQRGTVWPPGQVVNVRCMACEGRDLRAIGSIPQFDQVIYPDAFDNTNQIGTPTVIANIVFEVSALTNTNYFGVPTLHHIIHPDALLNTNQFGVPQFDEDGIMQKCDFCLDRLEQGQKPVCELTCTAHALHTGTMEELSKMAAEKAVQKPTGATQPSVLLSI